METVAAISQDKVSNPFTKCTWKRSACGVPNTKTHNCQMAVIRLPKVIKLFEFNNDVIRGCQVDITY